VSSMWRGDFASAERDLLAVGGQTFEVSINLGLLYGLQGRLDEAKAQYLKALAFDITSARAHAGIAEVFRKMGNESEAREAFRNARTLDDIFMRSVYGESGEIVGVP
jgi:tetratricopeptide (TPR) repeat protein